MNEVVPVASAAPPDDVAYQSTASPAPALADIVTVPAPQRELPIPDGTLGVAFTTRVTEHEL